MPFLILVATACGPQERSIQVYLNAVNEKWRWKSYRLWDYRRKAMVWGDSISTEAQKPVYIKSSKKQCRKRGDEQLNIAMWSTTILDWRLLIVMGFSIRRVSNRFRNPTDKPNKDEVPLLEATMNTMRKMALAVSPTFKRSNNGKCYLYTKEFVIPKWNFVWVGQETQPLILNKKNPRKSFTLPDMIWLES